MSTDTKQQLTYVTDPFPAPPGDGSHCGFGFYPTPDAVEFCENRPVGLLIAPCCGTFTYICGPCLQRLPIIGYWLCQGCGTRTDCKWTPVEFGFRWLT